MWFESYYQGDDAPQLTVRAVLVGGCIGTVMAVGNLYTMLKVGWAFGVAITACVMSFAAWNSLMGLGLAKSKMSVLENNCMQSTASAAGYSTGCTVALAAGALLLITGDAGRMGWIPLTIWVFAVAVLGVLLAIPMKRQMINREQLPFPTGIAAAQTLRSLHAEGAGAVKQARLLVEALLAGGLTGVGLNFGIIPAALRFTGAINSGRTTLPLSALGIGYEPSLMMLGAGAMVGLRVASSMLAGAMINCFVLAPLVISMDTDWVELRDRPRPGTIDVHLDDFGVMGSRSVTEAPAVQLIAVDGGAHAGTLADDGKYPDLHANDGNWAARITTASAPESVTLLLPGRALVGDDLAWADGNERRDLHLAVRVSGLLAKTGEEPRSGKVFAGDLEVKRNTETGSFKSINVKNWSRWLGTSLLVAYGLTALALNSRSVFTALFGRRSQSDGGDAALSQRMAAIEVPTSWMLIGLLPTTALLCFTCWFAMGIAPWLGVVAVALSAVLSLVACRVTGETDHTPIGALSKITQFIYAGLSPANTTVNLMTAGITAGAAGASADLLTDLKSGYLLGANPRKQFLAQLAGVFFGVAAVIPAWYLLVPTADTPLLQNSPSTAIWYAVAQALSDGVGAIPLTARYGMVLALIVGVALPLLERVFPKAKPWLPSGVGLGLAFVVSFPTTLAFFVGALIADRWTRRDPPAYQEKVIPLASGAIAGESIVSAGLAMLRSMHLLPG